MEMVIVFKTLIDVDGLVRVGDQSVGGDGYVLPAVKGTEGQESK